MKLERMKLTSASGSQINLDALYQICPSCFTEVHDEQTGKIAHKINFNTLRELLGDNAYEGADEEYGFSWVGKNAARREAAKPINKTLRPCPEESVDWESTQNLYIEGDNLEVLKLLQKSYMGKVKMIYIDPPYNTGNDFVYRDDFAMRADDYELEAGNINIEGNRFRKNTENNGRFHSDWCSMIYERLLIARTLLTDDGAIFISINDCEVSNLMKICDDVFQETNNIVRCIWINGRTSASHFTNSHEYILAYAKNIHKFPLFEYKGTDAQITDRTIKKPGTKNPLSDIEFPAGIAFECDDKVFPNKFGKSEPVEIVKGIFECKDGKLKNSVTIRAAWAMADMIKSWLKGETIYDQKGQIVTRFFFKENGVLQYEKAKGTIHPNSVIQNITTKTGTNEVARLIGENLFPFPKPIGLINYLMPMVNDADIVLDFFSGSATTAHAVMQLNADNKSKCKFIMVQLPEQISKNSEAYKAGYKNICEIGKERIRRAGKKIKEEAGLQGQHLDTGFRVFKCEDSFMNDVYFSPNTLKQEELFAQVENIKEGTSDLCLLFGCMLDWGVQLSLPLNEFSINGKKVYNVNEGDLIACFAEDIDEEVITSIAELSPLRVVFRDSCFKEVAFKMNLFELFKQKCGWSEEQVKSRVHVI